MGRNRLEVMPSHRCAYSVWRLSVTIRVRWTNDLIHVECGKDGLADVSRRARPFVLAVDQLAQTTYTVYELLAVPVTRQAVGVVPVTTG